MRTNPTLRTILILAVLFMATYALADGIRSRSIPGILMALASMLALLFVAYLSRKLSRLREEEEDVTDPVD